MSLFDQAQELESVADADLVRMAGMPDGRYPPFLIISEMQRRKKNRAAYQAELAKMEMPEQSIADREIIEFSQGAMPSESGDPASSISGLASIAPNPNMMRAAGGGLTRMQAGENLPLLDKSDEELMALGFDPDTIRGTPRSRRRRLSPEEIERNRLRNQVISEAFSRTPIGSGLSNIYDFLTQTPDQAVKVPRAKPRIRNGNEIVDLDGQGSLDGQGNLVNQGSSSTSNNQTFDPTSFIEPPNFDDVLLNTANKKSVADRIKEYEDSLDFTQVTPRRLSDEDIQEDLKTRGILGLAGAVSSARNLGEIAAGAAKVGEGILGEKERLETKQLEADSARRTQELEERSQALEMIRLDIAADTADKASDAQFFNLVGEAIKSLSNFTNPDVRNQALGILEEAFRVRGLSFPDFISSSGLPGVK